MGWLGRLVALIALVAAGLAATWVIRQPSHDRDWADDHSRLPTATPTSLTDVRDWTYAQDGSATERRWITARIDPGQLTRVWFVVEPFTEYEAVAHTMLSFEFADGTAYVASVEARREVGDVYQPIRAGLLPTYEYLVVWATERDMYANTVYWAAGELYMYPLDLSPEQARAVLRGMLDLTAEVAERPRWYNTFFSNCANVLARTMNDLRPGSLPRSTAWYLPGYSGRYLHALGYIAGSDSFPDAKARARATDAAKATLQGPADTFPARLRAAME